MTGPFRILLSLLLAALALPGIVLAQEPVDCDLENCEVVLLEVESLTDWTTNCEIVTIPRPAPGEPDLRQICDPTFLLIRDPTCGPEGTDSDFLELTDEQFCLGDQLPCNAVGFRSFCMETTLAGEYTITNAGAGAGELVFNLAGCTKIYRRDDIFNPLCALEGGGERIGLTLPAPTPDDPLPTVEGAFDTLSVLCSLDGDAAAALFADACEDPENFCFDAFSDGFIEIVLSSGNLIAETMLSGSAKICASYATFDFEVLADLIESNCGTCDEVTSPNGVVPVSFILPDDGDDAVQSDYENPANYRIVIDDQNDGDNEWDQTIIPTGTGTFEFTDLPDGDFTVAIIYVPLAGDKQPNDQEACGFCVRNVTVGLIAEPVIDVEITDDCIPSDGDPSIPAVGTGVIDLTVIGADNISFLWDNEATTPRIENLEAGQYCVTISYGPPASDLDPTGRCSVCLCFEVGTFSLTCDILGDALICGEESTTLTAIPGGGSGNYSYLWSTGETTPSITVSPTMPTLYEVTITDEDFNGDCFSVCSKEVAIFNPTCEIEGELEVWLGAPTTLTANIPGEEGNFEYLWSTGDRTATITVYPVEPTTYSVTITQFDDAGNPGCIFECSETVWVMEPACEIEGAAVVCEGQNTELKAFPPAKERNYQYKWSTGSDEQWVNVFPTKESNLFSVTITDVSDQGEVLISFVCEHEIKVIEPTCSIKGDNQLCQGESATLTAEVSGGTGNYRYLWSDGQRGASISVSPLTTTTYEVTVTDVGTGEGADCSFTCSFTVFVNDLSCSVSGDDRICHGESTLLAAQPSGGSGSYRYRWSTGAATPTITVSPDKNKRYRVTVTDLDGSGNPICSTVCEREVKVSNPFCSIIDLVDVACGNKGAFTFTVQGGFSPYTYEVTSKSGVIASGIVAKDGALVTVDGLMSGEYTVNIKDEEGCTTSCKAVVAEIEGGGDFTGCLACNDLINITLDEDCSVAITLDMVAEGDIRDCDKTESLLRVLEVIVYDGEYPTIGGQPRPDNVVDKCGVFNYSIILKEAYEDCFTWTHCWGQINAEEKSPVVEIKPVKVQGIYKYKDREGKTQFTPYNCESEDFEACFEDPNGSLIDDCSTFEFHYLTCDDLESIYQESRSYYDPTYPYFVGRPNLEDDCCGPLELIGVQDWVEEVPCDDRDGQITAIIRRTFTYRNGQGIKATAVQEICFYRPEVILPDCKLHVDICDFESAGGSDDLLKPDQLFDLVREGEEPLPFYYNGIGEKIFLTDHSCDLTASYVDQEFPASCGKKIIRTWSILDWCWNDNQSRGRYAFSPGGDCYDGLRYQEPEGYAYAGEKTLKIEQHIIVEATREMTIECQDINITTGPFNCTAVVVPPPPQVDDCFATTFEFELWGYVVNPKTRLKEYQLIGLSKDGKLPGVPIGTYDLYYHVEDDCGRIYSGVRKNSNGTWEHDRDKACVLTVTDEINPVAVCDDDLHVSIGGSGTSADGVSKVRAADVGEGSWDNCGEVELAVRRSIDVSCLDTYTEKVHHLTWPSDYVIRYQDGRIIYLAGKDVPELAIREGDPLITQELGGRFFSRWLDAAYFTCCDISSDAEDRPTLELRVTDKAGNTNVCWLDVLVEDKVPPRCDVHDKVILCTDLDFDPADSAQVAARFGGPEDVVTVLDNCGYEITEEVTWNPDNCGAGEIVRVFTITDNSGLKTVCRQTIEVKPVLNYEIVFPGDVGSQICGEEPVRDLTAQSMACDILAVNRDTTRFEASGEECFKLLITYRVINWCEYDGFDAEPIVIPRDWDGDKKVNEDTKVTVDYRHDLMPEVSGTQMVIWTQADGGLAYINQEDYLSGEYNAGFWEYSQLVKVYDDIAPTITVDPYDDFCAFGPTDDAAYPCGANVTITFAVDDECTPDDVEVRSVRLIVNNMGNPVNGLGMFYDLIDNEDGTFTIQSKGNLPEGNHTFVVQAADGCGNLTGMQFPFTVKDCKSPAPICISQLTVDLMPVDVDNDNRIDGGMNTVWATDFIASGIQDCNPHPAADVIQGSANDVKYFAFKQKDLANGDPGDITLDSLTDEHTSVVFTCDDEGMEVIYVIALDGADQFDYCAVMAIVQPGIEPSPCGAPSPAGGSITGLIITEEDMPVGGVTVQLSGEASRSVITGDDGLYTFATLRAGHDYSIKPRLDIDHLNGVSTFDLLMITKHILGVKRLDSPYRLIAADVNKSRSITTLDVIKLRKSILGLEPTFTGNTSWRFVRADYAFANPQAPWNEDFPEVYSINDLASQLTAHDFVAVKVGDVNGSARANGLSGEIRTVAGTFPISVQDQQMKAGAEYTVTFKANVADIQGYQFTLNFDRNVLELVDVIYGVATEEHFGIFAKDGMITTSWNGQAANGELFSLVFQARADGQLSELINVSSRLTEAEAYNTADQTLDVVLNFGQEKVVAAGFELFQNTPNPFKGQTTIGFTLPDAANATIRVSDINGRMLKVINGQFNKGYNEVRLNSEELQVRGVLYYTVESADHTATKKMIIIE